MGMAQQVFSPVNKHWVVSSFNSFTNEANMNIPGQDFSTTYIKKKETQFIYSVTLVSGIQHDDAIFIDYIPSKDIIK